MSKKTNDALRRYGFVSGKEEGWCAACERTFQNSGPGGFKCHPCAYKQFCRVQEECRAAGMEG